MKRIMLLAILGVLTLGGWAWSREQEMINHSMDVHMEEMQDASCPPSSDPPGGG